MTNNPYLWDKSGPKDSFIAKLERLLSAKRSKVKGAGRRPRLRLLRIVLPVAAAAAVVAWVCFGPRASKVESKSDAGSPQIAVEAGGQPDSEAGRSDATKKATKKALPPDNPVGETTMGQPGYDAPSPTDTEK